MAYTTINESTFRRASHHDESLSARLVATFQLWRKRARERNELARLTARDARDLGIDPGLVSYEASKPFWKA
jgi:uncharacterized protein YjiS (DUF1127 family)